MYTIRIVSNDRIVGSTGFDRIVVMGEVICESKKIHINLRLVDLVKPIDFFIQN